jgi:hypothetical protein
MATIEEVVNGISQVIGLYGHDGALDDKGDPIAIGLKREEEIEITDRRVMDGFGVKVMANKLTISYHSECMLEDVHNPRFENEIEQMIEKVASFLKKYYKMITKNTLSLKKDGEVEAIVQNTSRVRAWVQATVVYTIQNIDAVDEVVQTSDEKLDKAIKSWLDQSTDKKPQNVSISKADNQAK